MIRAIKLVMDNRKRARDILWTRIGGVIGHRNYKKFIVLSRGRTGSNMLLAMLNSHPSIFAEGEIFARPKGKLVEQILNKIYRKYPRSVKAVGFKIFYFHPVADKSGTGLEKSLVWDTINAMEDLYVIHLKRRNILRTLLSSRIAFATDVWTSRGSINKINVKDRQVQFTEDELLQGFKQTREWEVTYGRMLQSKTMIDIFYEDMLSNPQREFLKITSMLDLAYYEPRTDLKRQNVEKLSDLIVNYESLKRKFTNTEWSCFFED